MMRNMKGVLALMLVLAMVFTAVAVGPQADADDGDLEVLASAENNYDIFNDGAEVQGDTSGAPRLLILEYRHDARIPAGADNDDMRYDLLVKVNEADYPDWKEPDVLVATISVEVWPGTEAPEGFKKILIPGGYPDSYLVGSTDDNGNPVGLPDGDYLVKFSFSRPNVTQLVDPVYAFHLRVGAERVNVIYNYAPYAEQGETQPYTYESTVFKGEAFPEPERIYPAEVAGVEVPEGCSPVMGNWYAVRTGTESPYVYDVKVALNDYKVGDVLSDDSDHLVPDTSSDDYDYTLTLYLEWIGGGRLEFIFEDGGNWVSDYVPPAAYSYTDVLDLPEEERVVPYAKTGYEVAFMGWMPVQLDENGDPKKDPTGKYIPYDDSETNYFEKKVVKDTDGNDVTVATKIKVGALGGYALVAVWKEEPLGSTVTIKLDDPYDSTYKASWSAQLPEGWTLNDDGTLTAEKKYGEVLVLPTAASVSIAQDSDICEFMGWYDTAFSPKDMKFITELEADKEYDDVNIAPIYKYKVELNVNKAGYTGDVIDRFYVTQVLDLPSAEHVNSYVEDGTTYIFSHWEDADGKTVTKVDSSTSGKKVYTAIYKALDDITVVFDHGEGTGTMDSVDVKIGDSFILPDNKFIPPAQKVFKSWKIKGTEYSEGQEITISREMAEGGVITVTAIWSYQDAYTITLDPGRGTWSDGSKVIKETTYTSETGKDLTEYQVTPYTKTGYSVLFTGWYVNGTSIIVKDRISPGEYGDKTLVAAFTEVKSGGGGGGGGGDEPLPPQPEHETIVNPDGTITERVTERSKQGQDDVVKVTDDTDNKDGTHTQKVTTTITAPSGYSTVTFHEQITDADGDVLSETDMTGAFDAKGIGSATTHQKVYYDDGSVFTDTVTTLSTHVDGSSDSHSVVGTYDPQGNLISVAEIDMKTGSAGTIVTDTRLTYIDQYGRERVDTTHEEAVIGPDGNYHISSRVTADIEDGTTAEGTMSTVVDGVGNIRDVQFDIAYSNPDSSSTKVRGSGDIDRLDVTVSGSSDRDIMNAVDAVSDIPSKEVYIGIEAKSMSLSADAIGMLADRGYGMTLTNGDQSVTLDPTVVKGLAGEGNLIELVVEHATEEVMTEEQEHTIRDYYAVNVYVRVNGVVVHELYGGRADVMVKPGYDALFVYYVDEDGNAEFIQSQYDRTTGKVSFEVTHFSIYMITAEKYVKSSDDSCWIWILVILVIILILLLLILFVLRHKVTLDLGDAKPVSVPEGWKQPSDSQSILYRRFWHGKELEIPVVNVAGKTIVSWYPDLPEKVKESETFQAVYAGENKEDIVLK